MRVRLQGLLDMLSQVTLMQQLVQKHFTHAGLGKAPVVLRLRAVNRLDNPYTSNAGLDLEVRLLSVYIYIVVIVKRMNTLCTAHYHGMNEV